MPVSQENMRSALGKITQDSKIQEAKYAQIITTQEQRDEAAMPERLMIYPRQLVTFPNHPFYIRDDEDMSKLKESIMNSGIRRRMSVARIHFISSLDTAGPMLHDKFFRKIIVWKSEFIT